MLPCAHSRIRRLTQRAESFHIRSTQSSRRTSNHGSRWAHCPNQHIPSIAFCFLSRAHDYRKAFVICLCLVLSSLAIASFAIPALLDV
ncbi:uncharacterized protein BDR25DRAFT_100225 [Lindgomyces ingoldianus]|uniref:Uncharacterized protein n=1 Tax=Lindgomyces ingoldianus TaxID=673940 RepID=A0ACB6R757_9PLEO|nr:uncharacterized protein BDR25DRAFT_100225 [Lindgomyces ingoldianus]KAF2475143.1 hypothetical protein BDR25DRAFT_100225 [Lindgomyces ingoldianus]